MRRLAAASMLAFIVLAALLLTVQPAKGAWLTGWQYRKKITLDGVQGAGVGYQVKFRLYRGSGQDSGSTIYLNSHCQDDFDDVRFADMEGNVFSQWIEQRTLDYIDIWVEVGVDLNLDQVICLYYGNSTATRFSDFDSTFVFGELWNSSTLDTNKWTKYGTWSGTVTVDTNSHVLSVTPSTSGTWYGGYYNFPIVYPENFIVENAWTGGYVYAYRQYQSGVLGWNIHNVDNSYIISDMGVVFAGLHHPYSVSYLQKIAGVGGGTDWSVNGPASTSLSLYFKMGKLNGRCFVMVQDVGVVVNETNMEAMDRFWLGIYHSASNFENMQWGSFRIRKWVQPEPTVTAVGPEECISGASCVLNVAVEPSAITRARFWLDYPQNVYEAPLTGLTLTPGSHNVSAIDMTATFNGSYIYGFKCWKKNGAVYSYEETCTFTVETGQSTDLAIVYEAYRVDVSTSPSGLEVWFEADGWSLTTPATIYRGPGYHTFEVSTMLLNYNSTHMLKFLGWFVDNLYISPSATLNVYIAKNCTIIIAYSFAEIPAAPPMVLRAQHVTLGEVPAGSTRDFAINVLFDQAAITVKNITFTYKPDWFKILEPLPKMASRGLEPMGTVSIQAQLTAPPNVQGYYSIPFTVQVLTQQEMAVTTTSYVTFTVTSQPEVAEATTTALRAGFDEVVRRLLGDQLLLALLIILILMLAYFSLRSQRK